MAPAIMRAKNLRFVIFPKDHDPPHVHVFGPGAEAKFILEGMECIYSRGFSSRAIREIASFLHDKEERFREAWNELQE